MRRPVDIARKAMRAATLLLSGIIVIANARLYHDVDAGDVHGELRFVRRALDRGEAARMQKLFPEGFLFSHVLYGLAWVEQGMGVAVGDPLRSRALTEASWALD